MDADERRDSPRDLGRSAPYLSGAKGEGGIGVHPRSSAVSFGPTNRCYTRAQGRPYNDRDSMKSIAAILVLGLGLSFADDEPLDPTKYKFPTEAKSVEGGGGRTSRERAYLGVRAGEESDGADGVLLGEVIEDGPAAKAGLQSDDRIVRFGGKEIADYEALNHLIGEKKPGDEVEIVVDRDGEEMEFRVVLGGRSEGSATGLPIWKKPHFHLGVVIFEFADGKHNPDFQREDFDRMHFSRKSYAGTNPSGERVYGSLADYYAENSGGKLAISGRVFDWVTLDDPRGYFEEKRMGDREAFRRLLPRAVALVQERDGEDCFDDLDGLVFLYAGKQSYLRPLMLWPHRANLRVGKRSLPYYLTAEGGKYFNAINVHVHEFGHMLGLPDQYGRKHATGIGKWCTMSVGHMGGGESRAHRPFHLCVWCKEQLGWVKVTTVRPSDAQWLKLAAIQTEPSMAFLIPATADGSESYYLENRQRRGFDGDLEGTGLLIWKVRRGLGGVDLIESHGRKVPDASLVDLEEIPWPSLYNRHFTPSTKPASAAGVYLTDIVEKDGVVYFKIGTEKAARSEGLERRRDY